MISGQIRGSKLWRVFTLGDGCWLPILDSELNDGFVYGTLRQRHVAQSLGESQTTIGV